MDLILDTSNLNYRINNDGTILLINDENQYSFRYILKPILAYQIYSYTSKWYDSNTNELIAVIYYDSNDNSNTLIYKKDYIIIVSLLFKLVCDEAKFCRYFFYKNDVEYNTYNTFHYELFQN
jgi:hypothetical protein